MIHLIRAREATIEAMLRDDTPSFSYAEVGATADPSAFVGLAARYTIDHRRYPLGEGRETFDRACEALFAWRGFEIPWLALRGADRRVHLGQNVVTQTRVFGVGFATPCRVVYVEPPDASATQAAFAYGTRIGHVVEGEERFGLRRDPATGAVALEIIAFSRPATALSRLGRPILRRIQGRFGGDFAEALRRAMDEASAPAVQRAAG